MNYYAQFTPAEEGGFNITFRDLDCVHTCGDDYDQSFIMAEDGVLAALSIYADMGQKIPLPTPKQDGEVAIAIDICTVAKILLHNALVERGTSKTYVAKCLGISPQAFGRFTDFYRKTKVENIEKALKVLDLALNLNLSPLNA